MTFKAAILTAHNQPLELVELSHEIIGESRTCATGQVRCEILVSGICGAQISEIAGVKNNSAPTPRLIGHEACGIVREVGPGVSAQLLNKKVILHWRKGEGPYAYTPARYRMGNQSIGGGDITTFTQSAVVSANRVTAIPNGVPDEICALLGCSLSTALGTIEHEAKLKLGESVLILGVGGVGLNLIIAARAAGAGRIVTVDKDNAKGGPAMRADANAFLEIGMIGEKFDVIIDTTGNVDVLEQTIPMLSERGRYVMLGQTKPGQDFRIRSAVDRFYGEGARLIWSQGGGFNPTSDIPRYVSLWDSGRLNLDAVVSHRFKLEDINTGLDLVRAGQAGRIMISMK